MTKKKEERSGNATYTVNIECANCDYIGTSELPKGQPFNEAVTCPNCGCKSAKKQQKPKAGDILPFKASPWRQPSPWTLRISEEDKPEYKRDSTKHGPLPIQTWEMHKPLKIYEPSLTPCNPPPSNVFGV